ncbi:lysostaphin resistance A-like protein [Prosthecobacter sp.]|uniref:lysostaphin resistance A-like protein n=1 Tax=Prosthecobacter sp. TaxID=1965333 RepID=UPI0037846226
MVDASSFGVLHDLAIFASIVTALSLVAYRMMRELRPEVSWNREGAVMSSPYGAPDLVALAGLGLFYILVFMQPADTTAAAAAGEGKVNDATLVAGMLFHLIVCAGVLLYLFRLRGMNPGELFGLQNIHWRTLAVTVAVFTVVILVCVNLVASLSSSWLQSFWPHMEPQETVKAFQQSGGYGLKLLVVLLAVVIAPLAEETLFRGFVYGVLKRYTDAPFAALASSLMFAIIHMHIGSLMPLWMLAVLLCLAYEITGCLLVPMILHAIFNGVSIVMMLFGEG